MANEALDLDRLSLNQMTTRNLSVREVADLCLRHKIKNIGLWREPVSKTGIRETARIMRDTGLHVSSLCRGGFFTAASEADRAERMDDNFRAVEEAAQLGADTLVLVCGGTLDRDLQKARRIVCEAVHKLSDFAKDNGVRLGVEPLHPMYTATRSVVVTLAQALLVVANLPPRLAGVVIDVYHVWWDPDLYAGIENARGRIFGFHICDWLDPMPDFVNGRGMMGDGYANIRRIRQAIDASGYSGPIEVEIFNQKIWEMEPNETIKLIKERWRDNV
jgi:sugar phosphate isomerase/epimerase